jgi:hypothetical protein
MTAPTEEKLTSSTLQPSTLPTHVAGRERERERRRATHHCLQFLQPNEKQPILFLVLQKFGSAASETSTIGTQRSAVTLSPKTKAKENLRRKSNYCIARFHRFEYHFTILLKFEFWSSF